MLLRSVFFNFTYFVPFCLSEFSSVDSAEEKVVNGGLF